MNNNIQNILTRTLFLIFIFSSNLQAEDKWDYILAPYLQAPFISGNASLGRVEGADIDVGPSDIVDTFSYGIMFQAEAHHDSGLGFVLNYGFMMLEDSFSGPRDRVDVAGDVFQGVMEGFVSYRQNFENSTFDFYTGVRWWDFDLDLSAKSQIVDLDFDRDASWVDPVVGFRFIPQLSDDWRLLLQGDIGGFEVSSDSSFAVAGGVITDLSDSTAITLLYKAVWVDYSKGQVGTTSRFEYDTVTHGPLVGMIFKY